MSLLNKTLTALQEHLKNQVKNTLLPPLLPKLIKWRINTYAPYLGAGVKMVEFDLERGRCSVAMPLTALNKNVVGTQFGGSLYSMVDPFYMLLLMQMLGDDYVVWDKAAHINFVAPGKSTVTASMHLSKQELATVKELAKNGDAVFRDYEIDIVDSQSKIVATVTKTVYIRRRQFSGSKAQGSRISKRFKDV